MAATSSTDVPALDVDKKPSLSKKFSESLKKSFTPRTASRSSTPAGPSAATTPKAGVTSPRDVKAEAKAAAKAAKETVEKKAKAAAAATKDAANKAGAAARDAGAKAKKAIKVREEMVKGGRGIDCMRFLITVSLIFAVLTCHSVSRAESPPASR